MTRPRKSNFSVFTKGRRSRIWWHKALWLVSVIYVVLLLSSLSTVARNPTAVDIFRELDLPVSYVHVTQLRKTCSAAFGTNKSSNAAQDVSYVNKTILTLFTSFKDKQERFHMHSFVVKNWASLGPEVQLVLFTTTRKQTMLEKMAEKHGWDVMSAPGINKYNTPFIKAMYKAAYRKHNTDFYAYANGDILFSKDLVDTLKSLKQHFYEQNKKRSDPNYRGEPFIIGQRRDFILDSKARTLQGNLWDPSVVFCAARSNYSISHRNDALDYFITTKEGYPWNRIPDLVIGRIGYDQYLLLQARFHNLSTIDATLTNPVLHLQGPNGLMAHVMDRNKDAKYNMRLLKKYHPKGIPWTISNTSTTQYFTYLGQSDLGQTRIHITARKGYQWPSLYPYFTKYRKIENFNDEHVVKQI